METASPASDVLAVIPPTDQIIAKIKATREEQDALKRMLKIAVRRDNAQELRSRSVQTAGQ